MAFIQIFELKTTRYDEIEALEHEWLAATEGKRTLQRETVGRDRNDPDHYIFIAEFPSYEEAVKNSELPETAAVSEKMAALCDGPLRFIDLDVVKTGP